MLCGSVMFTCMGAFTRAVSTQVHWSIIALARTVVAVIVAATLARVGRVPVMVLGRRALWVRSICGSMSLVFSFMALSHLPMAKAQTLFSLYPIWILVLSWVVLGEKVRRFDILAIVSGIAGAFLIHPYSGESPEGGIAAIISSFFTAGAMLGLNRLGNLDPRTVVVHFSAVSSFISLGAALIVGTSMNAAAHQMSGRAALLLVGVGVSGTLGQLLLTKSYGKGRPPTVAAAGMSQIAFGAVCDVFIFDQRFEPSMLAGIALILGPSAWLLTRRLHRRSSVEVPANE
jgi:drug/metabolite transporter (DMT)-like permease